MTTAALAARVAPAEWDSAHFGVSVGRFEGDARGAGPALAEADRAGVRLVIARVDAGDLAAVQALEAQGFRLADTLVRYARALDGPPRAAAADARVRSATRADAPAVRAIAAEAFAGYAGHFRNDARLDPDLADRVYVEWAGGACREPDGDQGMVLAERGAVPLGFGLVVRDTAGAAEGVLYAVAARARGRGVAGLLVTATMAWAWRAGCRRMTIHSSLANPAAHAVWLRAGFAPAGGLHTLHRWSDRS